MKGSQAYGARNAEMVATGTGEALRGLVCRVAPRRDHLSAGIARDMGPPCLPVMGPS